MWEKKLKHFIEFKHCNCEEKALSFHLCWLTHFCTRCEEPIFSILQMTFSQGPVLPNFWPKEFCPWWVFLLISSNFHFHLPTHTILPYVKKPHSQSCKWPFIRNLCCPIFIPKDWLSSSQSVGFLLISWNFHKTSSSVTGLLSLIMDSGSHLPWSLPTFPVSPHSHSNAATQL